MSDFPFKGWDYAELGLYWGLFTADQYDEFNDEDEVMQPIKDHINQLYAIGCCDENNKQVMFAAADIRAFAKKLAEAEDYYTPLWKGLAAIKSDNVLLQMTEPLIGYMWI